MTETLNLDSHKYAGIYIYISVSYFLATKVFPLSLVFVKISSTTGPTLDKNLIMLK